MTAECLYGGELLACGRGGSMILFDASIWHGHTANLTSEVRRSVQGFVSLPTSMFNWPSTLAKDGTDG
jgi:hypothetical protein